MHSVINDNNDADRSKMTDEPNVNELLLLKESQLSSSISGVQSVKFSKAYYKPGSAIIALIVLFGLFICTGLVLYTDGYSFDKSVNANKLNVDYKNLNNYLKQEVIQLQLQNPTLSTDFGNGLMLVSSTNANEEEIQLEKFSFDETIDDYRLDSYQLPSGMHNCYQLSISLLCCNETNYLTAGTHCYIRKGETYGNHLHIKNAFLTMSWQNLQSEETAVILKSTRNHYHVLHSSSLLNPNLLDIIDAGNHYQFEPIAFYFSMDTLEELSELAVDRNGNYVICVYAKGNKDHYHLVGDDTGGICNPIRIMPVSDANAVKFCANPVYRAVVQYDNSSGRKNKSKIKWTLQISYTEQDNSTVYQLEILEGRAVDGLELNCEPTHVEIYVLSMHLLLKYDVFLPHEDASSLLASR